MTGVPKRRWRAVTVLSSYSSKTRRLNCLPELVSSCLGCLVGCFDFCVLGFYASFVRLGLNVQLFGGDQTTAKLLLSIDPLLSVRQILRIHRVSTNVINVATFASIVEVPDALAIMSFARVIHPDGSCSHYRKHCHVYHVRRYRDLEAAADPPLSIPDLWGLSFHHGVPNYSPQHYPSQGSP